jgi:large subunit ribosomal protein L24
MPAKIKKGDKVVVLAGKDKGKTGTVERVIPDETKAVVTGINLVRRHTKQTASQDAGIYTKAAPIHLSNIALIDPKSEPNKPKPTRVGFKKNDDGALVRVFKTTGEAVDG